jgi:hypothetical protein
VTTILDTLEALDLHAEVEVDQGGAVVRGRLLDYSAHHLWLYDHEGTDHDRPWRARLSTVTAVTRVPDPPQWSWAAVDKRRRIRL